MTIDYGPDRALIVTGDGLPTSQTRTHSPATLLRTAHHLNRLGAALGDAGVNR